MKNIFIYTIFSILVILLIYCNDDVKNTEIIQLGSGKYTGKFDVILYRDSIYKTGDISIVYNENDYDYTANITYASKKISDSVVSNYGWYKIKNDTINMTDISYYSSSPSNFDFEFIGSYFISYENNEIHLTEDNYYGKWNIRLKQNNFVRSFIQ